MATKIYPQTHLRIEIHSWESKNTWEIAMRYGVHPNSDHAMPLIAKGNRIQGVEAKE